MDIGKERWMGKERGRREAMNGTSLCPIFGSILGLFHLKSRGVVQKVYKNLGGPENLASKGVFIFYSGGGVKRGGGGHL